MAIVVGGGFSGAMVGAHLAARGIATTVVEPGELGRGLAYGPAAARDGLLLNTPACFMSALPDDPEHFARWHRGHRTGFATRSAYGAYVGETVAAMAGDRLVHVRARVVAVERRGDAFEVVCDDDSRHIGGALVLALGNAPPRALPFVDPAVATITSVVAAQMSRFSIDTSRRDAPALRPPFADAARDGAPPLDPARDGAQRPFPARDGGQPPFDRARDGGQPPFEPARDAPAHRAPFVDPVRDTPARGAPSFVDPVRDALASGVDAAVLVVGTGLTAIDAIAALRGRGHRGRITAVSRRGLVPMAYDAIVPPVHVPPELVARPSLRGLIAWWRSAGRGKAGDGAARAAGLRLATPAIWRALSLEERAAFVRHLRPRLDVVRHRAPPQLRALIDRGLADGWLEVIAGRLVELRAGACTIATTRGVLERTFASVVNATGPERDLARTDPLVRSLVERGWVVPDPLGLGAVTGPRGELAVPGAFAVGPWRLGQVWESTTVPELRVQAADTAAAIAMTT